SSDVCSSDLRLHVQREVHLVGQAIHLRSGHAARGSGQARHQGGKRPFHAYGLAHRVYTTASRFMIVFETTVHAARSAGSSVLSTGCSPAASRARAAARSWEKRSYSVSYSATSRWIAASDGV